MIKKTAIALNKANELVYHLDESKPLTTAEVIDRVIDIRNCLSDVLNRLELNEDTIHNLRTIKNQLILNFKNQKLYNISIEYSILLTDRLNRQLMNDNNRLKRTLLDLEVEVDKLRNKEQSNF